MRYWTYLSNGITLSQNVISSGGDNLAALLRIESSRHDDL
jgi:hypothetical protein